LTLVNESLAQIHGPSQVLIHFSNQFRKLRDGLDVFVPGLRIHLGNIIGVSDEARGLNDLERVCGCGQDDGDERIRMQRDRHGELLKIGGASLCRGRGRRGRRCRGDSTRWAGLGLGRVA
jgi:hypothetical protein